MTIKNTAPLVILILFSSCTFLSEKFGEKKEEIPQYAFNPALESNANEILASLSLEEKVELLHGNGQFFSAGIPRLSISEVQYADGPLGIREELERDSWSPAGWTTDSASFFPAGGGLSATWNIYLALKYGEGIGAEARARNKDYLLAPAINIQRSPLNGRNYEYFSEDPFLNGCMAVPYIHGVQSNDVAACVKHFAVNNQETNRGRIDVQTSERALREIYLPAFKAAVMEGHAYSVMGSYNKFRGAYLCENEYLLQNILKKEWGFKGTVISDWGATHSTVASALGGLDVEMGSGTERGYENWYMAKPLLEAVIKGELPESTVDSMAKRVIRVLLNVKKTDTLRAKGQINTKRQQRILYNVAKESIVLLKNDKDLLPIKASQVNSIAVIGENAYQKHASGGFGAGVKAKYEVSPMAGLKDRLEGVIDIHYAQGYRQQYLGDDNLPSFLKTPSGQPDRRLLQEAVNLAKSTDLVIMFIGSNRLVESEAADRKTMNLPFGQSDLVKAVTAVNPNTIVVIIGGTPFDLRVIESTSSTLLWSWFNGSEAGNALADVLVGQVNPSGKLPFTIPKRLEDAPAHATQSFPGDTISVTYKEDILVGYRWFDTKNIEPLFPFGHGLSYTAFEIDSILTNKNNFEIHDSIQVALQVRNVGNYAGQEVIQLYVQDVESSVIRPVKELKAFIKIELKPGESQPIKLKIPVKNLAFYDETAMAWVVEPGEYKLLAGASSRDIRQSISINVK